MQFLVSLTLHSRTNHLDALISYTILLPFAIFILCSFAKAAMQKDKMTKMTISNTELLTELVLWKTAVEILSRDSPFNACWLVSLSLGKNCPGLAFVFTSYFLSVHVHVLNFLFIKQNSHLEFSHCYDLILTNYLCNTLVLTWDHILRSWDLNLNIWI